MFSRKLFDTPKKVTLWILSLVVLVFLYLIVFDRLAPSTSDATLDAYVIPIRSQVSGRIVDVPIRDNQFIHKGELLFKIDPRPFRYLYQENEAKLYKTQDRVKKLELAVKQAEEEVKRNESDYKNALVHFEENKALYERGVVTKNTFIDSQDRVNDAKDELMEAEIKYLEAMEVLGPDKRGVNIHLLEAEAALKSSAFYLDQTRVTAPSDGFITHLRVRKGSFATEGETQMAFVDANDWWVVANLKENNLDRVKPGQKVDVTLNMYPGKVFKGYVESISWGVLPSSSFESNYLPEVKKTNNWIRLAQRFPVRIRIENPPESKTMRVGSSAIVTIYTSDSPVANLLPSLIQAVRAKMQYFY